MSKADYTHKIETHHGRQVIVIEDLDLGGKSVTNDIENVVQDIAVMEKVDPADHLIVYRDSDGMWDGWDHKGQDFVALREDSWRHAASKYMQLQVENTMATS